MSYDYFFFARRSDGGPRTTAELGTDLPLLGTPDAIRAALDRLFPATAWESRPPNPQAWFGLHGPPEFLVSPEEDGNLRAFKACRITRDEVRHIVRAMSVVAFDPQTGELIVD